MPIFPHTCILRHTTGFTKVSGEATPTTVDVETKCRFSRCSVSVRGANKTFFFQDETHLLLPGTAVVGDGDQIISVMDGYTGTYRIKDVDPVVTMKGIHHREAVIERAV